MTFFISRTMEHGRSGKSQQLKQKIMVEFKGITLIRCTHTYGKHFPMSYHVQASSSSFHCCSSSSCDYFVDTKARAHIIGQIECPLTWVNRYGTVGYWISEPVVVFIIFFCRFSTNIHVLKHTQ